jgi:hypothetical protein
MDQEESLRVALAASRRASYHRLQGGFPIPLAGALYWFVLAYLGTQLGLAAWANLAFILTGAIFPVALLFARIFGIKIMKSKAAVDTVLLPAFISMLLFWAYIVAAAAYAPDLIPLILAVGLCVHWPVIGWSYARTGLFSAHAVIRTVGAVIIWSELPDDRLTVLPLWVGTIYLLTVAAILVDVKLLNRRAGLELA